MRAASDNLDVCRPFLTLEQKDFLFTQAVFLVVCLWISPFYQLDTINF